jgi:hypothetical protein
MYREGHQLGIQGNREIEDLGDRAGLLGITSQSSEHGLLQAWHLGVEPGSRSTDVAALASDAISCSVFVPFAYSNRELRAYGISASTPDSVNSLSLLTRPPPRQTAFALRIIQRLPTVFRIHFNSATCIFLRLAIVAPASCPVAPKSRYCPADCFFSPLDSDAGQTAATSTMALAKAFGAS